MTLEELRTLQASTFERGSKTYFNSSLFFPPQVRIDVMRLYAFVRVADNYVDSVPQNREAFNDFVTMWKGSQNGQPAADPIIEDFVLLSKEKSFDPQWTDAFLASMAMDLEPVRYTHIDETLRYIYGSAEVIGLYMSAILGLPREAFHGAQMQGRAMQMINFIRDIAEDLTLGRTYLPMGETSLPSLQAEDTRRNPEEFVRFIRAQLERYRSWQLEAYDSYKTIPRRYRVPIQTATDMYNWTAQTIARDPFLVYEKKVKPSRSFIFLNSLYNLLVLPKPTFRSL